MESLEVQERLPTGEMQPVVQAHMLTAVWTRSYHFCQLRQKFLQLADRYPIACPFR